MSDKKLKQREQISSEYKWNIEDMYPDEALWDKDLAECLEKAEEYQCQHIAFPSISTGAYRYPVSQAATIAIETLKNYPCQYVKRIDIVYIMHSLLPLY